MASTYRKGNVSTKQAAFGAPDMALADVVAFAPGASKPKRSLIDPGEEPLGCSVDPETGDLALTSLENASGEGSVEIYLHAHGSPIRYTDPALYRFFFCSYDDNGDLFIDGLTKTGFGLAELSKGPRAG